MEESKPELTPDGYYASITVAAQKTRELKPRNLIEYRYFVKSGMDKHLHPDPNMFYKIEDWIKIGGWDGYIGREPVKLDPTPAPTPTPAPKPQPEAALKPVETPPKPEVKAPKPLAPVKEVPSSQRTGPAPKPISRRKSGSTTIAGNTYDWNGDD